MAYRTDTYTDAPAVDGGGYLLLIAHVIRVAREDAVWDPAALRWLRTSGVRWAEAIGIEKPECVAERIG